MNGKLNRNWDDVDVYRVLRLHQAPLITSCLTAFHAKGLSETTSINEK